MTGQRAPWRIAHCSTCTPAPPESHTQQQGRLCCRGICGRGPTPLPTQHLIIISCGSFQGGCPSEGRWARWCCSSSGWQGRR